LTCHEPEFCESAHRLGDDTAEFSERHEAHFIKKRLSIASILHALMHELPQVVKIDMAVDKADEADQIAFMLNAMRKPATVPLSLASLVLMEHTSNSLVSTHFSSYTVFNLAANFTSLRDLYEFKNVQNKVVDGTERFPENQQSLSSGISIEFRCLHYSLVHVGISEGHDCF
jgi:uncharacterized protein with von Willebrand factor type A (vWA) domain